MIMFLASAVATLTITATVVAPCTVDATGCVEAQTVEPVVWTEINDGGVTIRHVDF